MRLAGLLLLLASMGLGQKLDPVQWKGAASASGADLTIRLEAEIQKGWHLYSLTTPKPSISTTVKFPDDAPFEVIDVLQARPALKVDPQGNQAEQFEEHAVLYVRAKAKDLSAKSGSIQVRYAVCDDKQCLPPKRKMIEFAVGADALAVPPGFTSSTSAAPAAERGVSFSTPAPAGAPPQDLGPFLAVAFGLGIAAIFTPCVFPMIPFTMSYFLDQPAAGRLGRAFLFCAGIVVLFTALGIGLTAALGPSAVVQLSANPWVNTVIGGIFVALGLSLLGAFEITLPSGLLTKLNAASSGGGVIGTLLMGLTFALTSFACVGPFVGTLLAASVQGPKLQPALGMASFSSGLAMPFFFLALFPGFLKKLPKSGLWLMRVKIVFGFVVLALALKYFSVADVVLQWNFLTRERFLAVWAVLFLLPGLYLLGFLRLEGIKPEEPVTIPRLLIGIVFAGFALSLLPGMFGAPLGELEPYVPFAKSSGVFGNASTSASAGLPWTKNNLAAALEKARAENKKVFVNFTGYACTNCHWMKANMFTRPEVAELMKEFVLVELYTDGTDAESEANQKLQESRFQTVAIPFYVILTGDDQVVKTFPSRTTDPAEWVAFLKSGLS